MVDAVERARLFEGDQVARLFDDADGRLVAAGIAADRADRLVGLGQVEADLAMADLVLGVRMASASSRASRRGSSAGDGRAARRMGADAGQASQGRYQPIDGRRVAGAGHLSASLAAGSRRRGRETGPAAVRRSGTRATGPPPHGP